MPGALREPRAPIQRTGFDLKILAVDNEPTILRLVKTVLELHGYEVLTAQSAEDGLNICRQLGSELTLVLSDVDMPGMNGREFARCVASLPHKVPVILMSGYASSSRILDELKDGRVDDLRFLLKPFKNRELVDEVAEAIQSAKQSIQ